MNEKTSQSRFIKSSVLQTKTLWRIRTFTTNKDTLKAKDLWRLRTLTKFLIRTFTAPFNVQVTNKDTLKAKDLHKISNKEIYCPFQCSSQWKKKLFELISWPEVIEEYQNLR